MFLVPTAEKIKLREGGIYIVCMLYPLKTPPFPHLTTGVPLLSPTQIAIPRPEKSKYLVNSILRIASIYITPHFVNNMNDAIFTALIHNKYLCSLIRGIRHCERLDLCTCFIVSKLGEVLPREWKMFQ